MSLFVRKDLHTLLAEAGAGTLRRELGPVALVTLGIGAVIGAGIFVYTGIVASQNAGPALTLSMVLAGIACAFAGLCYAELASMIPVAGSAYTYAYATMGELIAWIIGWDLVLEYSLSSSSVAVGWSGYAVILLGELGIRVPPRLTGAPGTSVLLPDGSTVTALFNMPAVIVCLAITALLVVGIRESARVNTTIVIIKVAVLALFVIVGAQYVNTANLHPFIPPNTGQFGSFGWSGILRGAGIIFFAYIGFDAVSTASQEAKNPGRDIPIGILVSLAICTVSVVILRRIEPDVPRPFKTPGMPWVPIFGTLICLYLMSGLPLRTWIRLFVWLAIGLTIYFGYGRFRAAALRSQALAHAA